MNPPISSVITGKLKR